MAIVGNFYKIKKQLSNIRELNHVFDYLDEAIVEASDVHERIFSNKKPSFLKLEIGGGCFALEQVFFTKDRADCFFESHKKYVDFQLLLTGREQMELIDKDYLDFVKYEESKDFIFYSDSTESMKLVLKNNDLAIFFPDDAHMGASCYKKNDLVYKTVVKVPVGLVGAFSLES